MDLSLSPNLSIRNVFLEACEEGDLELVRILLARGANVNWREEGKSGLHYAAYRDDGDLLDLLLAQPGVEVNIKDSERSTPLTVACTYWGENVVRRLLQVDRQYRPQLSRSRWLHCSSLRCKGYQPWLSQVTARSPWTKVEREE